jgi:hypothetical protein
MSSSEGSAHRHEDLIAASRAVATWAHMRRSTWTDAPLTIPAVPPELRATSIEIGPTAAPTSLSPLIPVRSQAGGLFADPEERPASAPRPTLRSLARLAAATTLLASIGVGAVYAWTAARTWSTRRRASQLAAVPRQAAKRPAMGSLHVTSTPVGAQVLVDGRAHGVTPLTLAQVAPGRHTIALTSDAGTVERVVTVEDDSPTEIDELIFSGWVALYAPFDLRVFEGTRVLRPDDRNQVLLSPGRHQLRLENRALGYEGVRQVDVRPGEIARLSISPPSSTLSVTASDPADVWIDDVRFGRTPLEARPIAVGTHQLIAKRVGGGERRLILTATVKPFSLNVDFSKPAP